MVGGEVVDEQEDAAAMEHEAPQPVREERAVKKAKREKARRDRLNDRFNELARLCVEGTDEVPATDKGTIVAAAIAAITHARQQSAEAKHEAAEARAVAAELKQEKVELREEKSLLRQQLAEVQRSLAARKGVDAAANGGLGASSMGVHYAAGQVPALPPVFGPGDGAGDAKSMRPPMA